MNDSIDSSTNVSSGLDDQRDALLQVLQSYGSCAVAFSGGVDSAVVAQAAQLALGDRSVAVTGTSDSLAEGELDNARKIAKQIGIRHLVLATNEFTDPRYTQNNKNRCFYCKTELYSQMTTHVNEWNVEILCNGTNADDLHDFRPGMIAADEHQVHSPLADCGLNKEAVRRLAQHWNLPVWDKPAMPCLSSRVAYGEQVTPERLKMIDAAEQLLKSFDLVDVRVRYHSGDMARIEIPLTMLPRIVEDNLRTIILTRFKEIGFRYITVDIEGFRSGSLNQLVSIDGLDLQSE